MVRFHTAEFEWSHGKSPRGRGSWGFFFTDEERSADQVWFTPGSTTWQEAKKLATKEAKRRGSTDVFVAS